MTTVIVISVIALLAFIIKNLFSDTHRVTDDSFEQAGVKVVFSTGKITIKGRTYDVSAIQGIEHKQISFIGTEVYIKVDDFKKPIYMIGITGFNRAGERFMQRLFTALRKAGGPSFY